MLSNLITYVEYAAVTLILGYLLYSSIVFVPNTKVGIKEKLWSSKGSVENGIMALNGQAGFEPDVLRGGIHFLVPFMYIVHKKDIVFVPQGELAYVFARDGAQRPADQTLGSNQVASNFEDVRDFLEKGGCKGPQRKVLLEGSHPINLAQFVVLTKSRIYTLYDTADDTAITAMHQTIQDRKGFNTVVINSAEDAMGIVVVHDGPALPNGELIAPLVGETEKGLSTHSNFQNPDLFLSCGGFKGRQLQVLVDGTYYINQLFATVEIVRKTLINMGNVGVVISYSGKKGADVSGEEYQHGELVKEGERGVWEKPLLPGKYSFNIYAGKVLAVPTTNFILKWESGESGSKFDANLKEISLITKDAFEPTLPLSVVVHIDYRKAPKVIQRFGDIQQLVEQTLDPMVSAYFKNTAQTKTLIELLQDRSDIQKKALEDMRAKFQEYNLELQEVLIGTPRSTGGDKQIETILTQLRDRQIAREKLETYKEQQTAAQSEKSLREAEAVARQQQGLTESKIAIEIAENNGQARVKTQTREGEAEAAKITAIARAEGERVTTLGNANATRIKAEGLATAEAAENQVKAMGGPEIRLAQEITALITKAISDGKIPVVPSVVVGDGSGKANAVDAIAAMVLASQDVGSAINKQLSKNKTES